MTSAADGPLSDGPLSDGTASDVTDLTPCGHDRAEVAAAVEAELAARQVEALPEPRTPQEAMALARERISQSAGARGRGWDLLADLMGEPTHDLVERLRAGTVADELRTATAWLGEDTSMVTGALMSLDVFARGARRRTAAQDLSALREDREEVADVVGAAELASIEAPMRELADLCRREGEAWGRGKDGEGKALRARQAEVANAGLVETLPPVAKAYVEDGIANLTRTLGRLALAFLSAETGRDFQRAVLGDARGRSRL